MYFELISKMSEMVSINLLIFITRSNRTSLTKRKDLSILKTSNECRLASGGSGSVLSHGSETRYAVPI